jgi:hypothetical protein
MSGEETVEKSGCPDRGGHHVGDGGPSESEEANQQGLHLWVPYESEQEAKALKAIPPAERRDALLNWGKKPRMTPEELFNLFVGDHVIPAEIAGLRLATVARQVGELRRLEPDDIAMTDEEIARAILEFARG